MLPDNTTTPGPGRAAVPNRAADYHCVYPHTVAWADWLPADAPQPATVPYRRSRLAGVVRLHRGRHRRARPAPPEPGRTPPEERP